MDDITPVNNTYTNEPERPAEPAPADTGEFSYDGYQVVREEFFAHLFEPSVTFNSEKVSVNTACIYDIATEIENVRTGKVSEE